MKLFDALLGRTKPAQPDLERLFRLPGAAMQLQATYGLRPSGQAGVCYKAMAGGSFAATHAEFRQLLGLGDEDGSPTSVHEQADSYGYTWVVIDDADFERLVNMVHVVNSSLEEKGYGPQLLCSVFAFVAGAATAPDALDEAAAGVEAPVGTWTSATPVYLVYLFKQGTFYPFVPTRGEQRDLFGEDTLAKSLAEDLVIEKDLERRFPIWGVPVH